MSGTPQTSSKTELTIGPCLTRIREILTNARNHALRTVNVAMVAAYWEIGREIFEEEQRGATRADYGSQLLGRLSAALTEQHGRGFSERSLRRYRQFYLTYSERPPEIRYSNAQFAAGEIRSAVRAESIPDGLQSQESTGSQLPTKIRSAVRTESEPSQIGPPAGNLASELSWTHYRILLGVSRREARNFYEIECIKSRWSSRELQRQIDSLLFERLARSRDKEGVLALAHEGHEVHQPIDLVKDPYVLEFVGLPESTRWLESDLEEALISGLQNFLQELGRDLFYKIQDPAKLKRLIVDLIDKDNWSAMAVDIKGDAYEGLLERNAQHPARTSMLS